MALTLAGVSARKSSVEKGQKMRTFNIPTSSPWLHRKSTVSPAILQGPGLPRGGLILLQRLPPASKPPHLYLRY